MCHLCAFSLSTEDLAARVGRPPLISELPGSGAVKTALELPAFAAGPELPAFLKEITRAPHWWFGNICFFSSGKAWMFLFCYKFRYYLLFLMGKLCVDMRVQLFVE